MMDFLSQEVVAVRQVERERELEQGRWRRQLRELKARDARPGAVRRLLLRVGGDEAKRRRELFEQGLDSAQREGITVDAWFGYKFADPELSARAEWAGLIDDAAKSARDVWAA